MKPTRTNPKLLRHCLTNVAQGKPASQSSSARSGPASNGNDGDSSSLHDGGRCTETLNETSPWWRVDLLDSYPVQMVRVTTRGCCGQQPMQGVEVRVGTSDDPQQNRLCSWFPGALPEGQDHDFVCARPVTGRYVYVQMVGVVGVLSVCEVEVFTAQEFAKEQCAPSVPLERLSLYNQICYELHLTEGTNYREARQYCQRNSGDLVHTLPDPAFKFLVNQLERTADQLTTKLLWIGVQKVPDTQAWNWVNGDPVVKPRWGQDQPNSYVGEQNCVVLDGGRDWLWNDFTCKIDYLHWICEYRPQLCGSPDRQENTTVVGTDFSVNQTIEYRCPEGWQPIGDELRTCKEDGQWSGRAPSCRFVDCGPLTAPEDGELSMLDDRTTFGARARFTCKEEHALLGDPLRTCGDGGKWTGEPAKCLFAVCPEPAAPEHGSVTVRGNLTAGTEALFSCDPGHQLLGDTVTRCKLGGTWETPPPVCRLIDCGQPPEPTHGTRTLNGGTLLGDVATFSCPEGYTMIGSRSRSCLSDGTWSGEPTQCSLIDCGEPEVPADSYVTGYGFHVNSSVEYHCDDGFLLEGEAVRECRLDGTWSGQPPTCRFVDCSRPFALLHGDVQYLSGGTSLGSELQYSCSRNYQLVGEPIRVCQADGTWSGYAPTCEQIRCEQPEKPSHSLTTVTGNDSRRQKVKQILLNQRFRETFRVGAKVTYSCKQGYKVTGAAERTCLNTGGWSGLPPSCEFVDCGPPPPPVIGNVSLPSRATFYGAVAEYSCPDKYQLVGDGQRVCEGEGAWGGELPTCEEVDCGTPERPEETLSVSTSGQRVGDLATYSCVPGHRLVGTASRTCLATGGWSGAPPRCQVVDCAPLPTLENGRVYSLNESTEYDTLVEHHCFPTHRRRGPFRRRCTRDGTWSGMSTVCVPRTPQLDSTETTPVAAEPGGAADNSGDVSDSSDVSSAAGAAGSAEQRDQQARHITGAWTGSAVVIFLVAAVLVAVFWLRRRKQAEKNSSNNHSLEERQVPITTLPGMAVYAVPADVRPGEGIQTRPLPSRPNEEPIYNEADDSFSSGPDSFTSEPPAPDNTYANRDATYANGLHHGSVLYENGVSDASVTYANSGSDTGVSAPNGRPGSRDSGTHSPPVTVNGMQM
ncbi:CUB and sushi domain-containing protein 3 [Amphibalanus amphitrite]|uniref:CUB and sushi domain-containing protein 3 n=1 Tax=Amphibalanus amphitrite TaxID=1232801 RepID=A0A6A4X3K8_AMPAM|nr:CUB and sushi domain-containing protein 3 [Amphibalanus amphitrite]